MWLAELLRKFAVFYLKLIVALAFACVAAQVLAAWWHGVHISGPSALALFALAAGISLCAYVIRERRRLRIERPARRGAERTPVLPPAGGGQW
ncbi:MAG: hypothetical protein ACHP7P_06690 [Terriglobales bacterium]